MPKKHNLAKVLNIYGANACAMAEAIIGRINCPCLFKAKEVLDRYQQEGGYKTQGDAISELLLEFKKLKGWSD
jgi:hypothetical protein